MSLNDIVEKLANNSIVRGVLKNNQGITKKGIIYASFFLMLTIAAIAGYEKEWPSEPEGYSRGQKIHFVNREVIETDEGKAILDCGSFYLQIGTTSNKWSRIGKGDKLRVTGNLGGLSRDAHVYFTRACGFRPRGWNRRLKSDKPVYNLFFADPSITYSVANEKAAREASRKHAANLTSFGEFKYNPNILKDNWRSWNNTPVGGWAYKVKNGDYSAVGISRKFNKQDEVRGNKRWDADAIFGNNVYALKSDGTFIQAPENIQKGQTVYIIF